MTCSNASITRDYFPHDRKFGRVLFPYTATIRLSVIQVNDQFTVNVEERPRSASVPVSALNVVALPQIAETPSVNVT